MTSLPWRVVIGRLGRIGHGELKGEEDSHADFLFFLKFAKAKKTDCRALKCFRTSVRFTQSSLCLASVSQTGASC